MRQRGIYATDDLSEAGAIIAQGVSAYQVECRDGPWAEVIFFDDVTQYAKAYRAGTLLVPALAYSHVLRRLRRQIRDMERGNKTCLTQPPSPVTQTPPRG